MESLEKSNTSSLSRRRMAMLFSHSVSLVLEAPGDCVFILFLGGGGNAGVVRLDKRGK